MVANKYAIKLKKFTCITLNTETNASIYTLQGYLISTWASSEQPFQVVI